MFRYYFRKALASPTRLAVFYSVSNFLGMAFFLGVGNLFSLMVLVFGSATIGFFVAKDLGKRYPEIFEDKGKEHFYRSREYTKLLKKEEIPKTKARQKEYLKHLKTVEKVQTNNLKVLPKSLVFTAGISVLSILVEGGVTLTSLFLAFFVLFGVYGYFKTRSMLQKIANVRSRIIAANPSFAKEGEAYTTRAIVPKTKNAKAWRAFVIIILGLIVVISLVGHFVIMPRIEEWYREAHPDAVAVQEALEARYPHQQVGTSIRTTNSNSDKLGALVVSVDKAHMDSAEKKKAGDLICVTLGKDAQRYDRVVLQSMNERRFLVFYARKTESFSIECSPVSEPPASDPKPSEYIPAEEYLQPEAPKDGYTPDGTQPLNLDPGFQLRVE